MANTSILISNNGADVQQGPIIAIDFLKECTKREYNEHMAQRLRLPSPWKLHGGSHYLKRGAGREITAPF